MNLQQLQENLVSSLNEEKLCKHLARELIPIKSQEHALDIYQISYFSRIEQAMQELFPQVFELLEEDAFSALVACFLNDSTSKHEDLNDFAHDFCQFCLRQDDIVKQLPFWPDLVNYELLLNKAFHLPRPKILEAPDPSVENFKIVLVPFFEFACKYRVDLLIKHNDDLREDSGSIFFYKDGQGRVNSIFFKSWQVDLIQNLKQFSLKIVLENCQKEAEEIFNLFKQLGESGLIKKYIS